MEKTELENREWIGNCNNPLSGAVSLPIAVVVSQPLSVSATAYTGANRNVKTQFTHTAQNNFAGVFP